jgi:HPt (histidine-containing phosphotransfer) domain-containing protein
MHQTTKMADQCPITSSLLEEEPELFDLVAQFVERLPSQLAGINRALDEQNWPTLKQEVHDLKGLGSSFGFPIISVIARQIEDKLKQRLYADISPLMEDLNSICQRITLIDNPRALR